MKALTPRQALEENPAWYHTLELAPGVVTPGQIDHRRLASRLLPSDLKGRRALDVATYDGFWAMELERRGAEVVAIDIDSFAEVDLPPLRRAEAEHRARALGVQLGGRGFRLATGVLGSSAERVRCSVYDLAPEAIGGSVDFAFSADILIHLRDPVRALERVRAALTPGGTIRLMEPVSMRFSLLAPRRAVSHFAAHYSFYNWWYPNVAAVRAWLEAAGFVGIRMIGLHRPPSVPDMRAWHVSFEARCPPGS
ncbi:MAG: methyltransferase domain-containing protein [Thermoleophilaceae bacterium]|nr:methyltransferase domain-containing protein [Thermoleophilaceae bacterium]